MVLHRADRSSIAPKRRTASANEKAVCCERNTVDLVRARITRSFNMHNQQKEAVKAVQCKNKDAKIINFRSTSAKRAFMNKNSQNLPP
jgi:hypothetical protein